ncbi:MAG: FG-GAP-like repeat-containing protein [Ginsengibacter sp.]
MLIRICYVSLVLLILLNLSCTKKAAQQPLFQLMQNTGINFENNVHDQEINNSFLFRNFYNGGGVAIGDINNDGKSDVMLTSNMGENQLYLNEGSWQFKNITAASGMKQDSMWSTGVVMVDINDDGWLDIYVCNSGHMKDGNRKNKLYINNHDLTFTESSAQYGLDISAYTTQVSFFDYDMDGDLDCFMINNSPIPVNLLGYGNRRDLPDAQWPVAGFLKGGGDHLFRNDHGRFTEVSQQAGIHGSLISFGLGVSVSDVNNDGYPDIYVANDSYERDYLYINQKDGTFKDQLEQCMQHTSFSSMGADIADINNDGYPDIFTTDMLPEDDYRLKTLGSFDNIDVYNSKLKSGFYHQYMKNCLQLNNKNGTYSEISDYSGVSATDWSWGALFFDADNDGFNDIYVCNGVNRDVTNLDFMDFFANDFIQQMVMTGKKEGVEKVLEHIPVNPMINKAYRNSGNLHFTDAGKSWGFVQPSFSNGAAYGDLDNDGDLDLVVNNENGPAFIYKNNAREINKNNYIGFMLKGNTPNGFAIGSKIKVFTATGIFNRELIPSRGFQSSMDYKQIIGIGQAKKIDSVVIVWPDRSTTSLLHVPLDTVLVISEATQQSIKYHLDSSSSSPFLSLVKSNFDKHQEDDNIDFYYERNIPEMLSREGPKCAVGDVNGDGLQDIYIGGTLDHPGQIYLQTTAGGFIKIKEPAFNQFIDFEDEAVLFFDADHDGDLDLFVGPGGNNHPSNSRQMQNRLFKNDGKGNFLLDPAAFKQNGMNTAVAVPYDFNHDGYTDLFVGGRSVPREYGVSPTSYLYLNDGNGHFTDIAKTKNPDIANIGMVTGAVWANITGDSSKELVITGEWMATHIFSFNGDHFVEIKSNLDQLFGWWQTIAAADLDGDGHEDLVLGNFGENFYLHPDMDHPVKMWINDFNQNNTLDKILTYTVEGKDKPVFLKKELTDQFPGLKKQNLKHHDYAQKTVQELFSKELIEKSIVKKVDYCASLVAMNVTGSVTNGKLQFRLQKLPVMAQLSSINAVYTTDINSDGRPDLVMGGNNFTFPPQFGRLDASFGCVLLNMGNGEFEWLNAARSGVNLPGEIRDIKEVTGKDKRYMLWLQNDQFPVLYEIKSR